ncbi:MAG: PorT family protein [Bacteroidetes bacterium]|nr:PorT family protein [Bacteroidota bacterium]
MKTHVRLPYLCLVLLVPLALSAQESRNGPKVGLGIGTQTAGQFLAWSGLPKLGPIAGWSFEAPITSQVSLLIEPMYIGKGSVTVNSVYKTRSSIALNYLEMPLLLKVSTNPDPQGMYLSGGLMYGYLLHGKVKNFQYGNLVSEYVFNPSGTTNRGQWSAALGMGHEVGHWLLELRGQSSLNTFDRFIRSHNVVYSFQVAWRFATQAEKEAKRKAAESGD